MLTIGLTFRAEIALAFPFIAVAAYFHAKEGSRHEIAWFLVTSAVLSVSFVVFIVLQRPYVESTGGATGALTSFLTSFIQIRLMGRGIAVFVLAIGIFTSLVLFGIVVFGRFLYRFPLSHVLIGLSAVLPTLFFWIANPLPSRHMLFATFGVYLILASSLRGKLISVPRAMLLGAMCILANQMIAELTRPILVKYHNWTYLEAPESRRASQRVPIGSFPFDQLANQAKESVLREEAKNFSMANPNRVIYLAEHQYYLIANLLAEYPSLRLSKNQIGGLVSESTLLKSEDREIYIIGKYMDWPKDVLLEILGMRRFNDWKIKEQLSTMTRVDKATLPSNRSFEPISFD